MESLKSSLFLVLILFSCHNPQVNTVHEKLLGHFYVDSVPECFCKDHAVLSVHRDLERINVPLMRTIEYDFYDRSLSIQAKSMGTTLRVVYDSIVLPNGHYELSKPYICPAQVNKSIYQTSCIYENQ